MRALRLTLAAAALAATLAPVSASACQWEVYRTSTQTPAGTVHHPAARCVSP